MNCTVVTAVQSWRTFNGRSVKPSEMDHQHLSNVYWFHILFCDALHKWALDEINARFNGQLLDYRPHPLFSYEFQMLQSRNMLRWEPTKANDIHQYAQIVHNGKVIGEIQMPYYKLS